MLIAIQATPQITQGTVIAILIASTLLAIGLLVLIGIVALRTEKLLEFGNLFVVTVGIMTALIGFLVAFPLLVSGVFSDTTQVLAILSALFGTIVGLVGTFFGVKSSSDARRGAQELAGATIASGATPPTVSSVSPQDRALSVPPDTRVTATFSNDMDDASINTNTLKLVEGDALTPVAGRVEYDAPAKVATFIPSANLNNGSTYRATVTTDVKDQAGNALVQSFTWHFTIIS